uniref:Zinc knuckle CX2CX4HX4C domain-containing protein n=1 Tax=Chenopodium quinoa TaxID=63459 RepID=A0A803L735_CHEQI
MRRGMFIETGNSSSKWIDFQCERLSEFCFFCGRLDHTERECNVKEDCVNSSNEVVYQYGSWLKASPLKRSRTSGIDHEKEK